MLEIGWNKNIMNEFDSFLSEALLNRDYEALAKVINIARKVLLNQVVYGELNSDLVRMAIFLQKALPNDACDHWIGVIAGEHTGDYKAIQDLAREELGKLLLGEEEFNDE